MFMASDGSAVQNEGIVTPNQRNPLVLILHHIQEHRFCPGNIGPQMDFGVPGFHTTQNLLIVIQFSPEVGFLFSERYQSLRGRLYDPVVLQPQHSR